MVQNTSDLVGPDSIRLIQSVAQHGSMAGAARALGLVPSALSYRLRQLEERLDVLLLDRSSQRARLTPAAEELLRSGLHLLDELDALARRVKRIATGWEPQFAVAADALIDRRSLFELCEAFYATGAPTRLRLRAETLSGTMEALLSGQADLALGVPPQDNPADCLSAPLGGMAKVYVVAPQHPLARLDHRLNDADLRLYRAVAVADSTQRGRGLSHNLLPGQDVLTVPTMQHKLEAQLMGLGGGFLPEPLAAPWIALGRLVVKDLERPVPHVRMAYAWRRPPGKERPGRALAWWLEQLSQARTREALLRHPSGSAISALTPAPAEARA